MNAISDVASTIHSAFALGKKPNAAAESQSMVTARRLAQLTTRRDTAAAAAAQAKADAARLVSLPAKKDKPKKPSTPGLHRRQMTASFG